MSTTTLIVLFAGFVLLYGAIKNKNPLQVIQGAISGKAPATAASLQK